MQEEERQLKSDFILIRRASSRPKTKPAHNKVLQPLGAGPDVALNF